MMAFTYDDFTKAAETAGLLKQFSPQDLATAQKYPEFGMSILTLKQDYARASTPQQRALVNVKANELRTSYGNYTGGMTGGGYVSLGLAPQDFKSPYQKAIDRTQNEMLNMDFDYNPETDPVFSAYQKQYVREGQRAGADALAKAAALTGGVPSSYAVTAASQAGDYYASRLADKVPELEQQAYGRFTDEYGRLKSNLSALQAQDDTAYSRLLDQVNYGQNRSANDRAAENAQATDAKSQVDAILSAGGTPSAALVAKSGYPQEYIDVMRARYAQGGTTGQTAGKPTSAGTKEGGKSGDYSGGGAQTENNAVSRFNAGDQSDEVVKTLLTMGYTQAQLEAAGYKGSYFGGKPANAQTAVGSKKETSVTKYSSASVLGLGHGPLSDEAVQKLIEDGKVRVTGKDANGNLQLSFVNQAESKGNTEGYKDALGRAQKMKKSGKGKAEIARYLQDALKGGRITDAQVNAILDKLGY